MFSVCQNCYKWIGLGWSRWCKKAQMVQRSWLGRRLLQVLSSLMPHHLVDNKHLITAQKIETAAGAKVEIRGRHVQLWRLPWGRPEQSCRGQWKGAEDLWWLLITSSLGTVCGQTFFLWKHEDLPKWADITGACINVISIWPTSSQQIYFSSYSKCIFTSYANIFLNVLQIYFCKIFLSIICAAPQLKNLKYEQYKIWINDTSLV